MNVRTIIVVNRGLKWKIDGRLYEHEMYIPEIVRDKKVNSYEQQRGIMIVTTKDQTRFLSREKESVMKVNYDKAYKYLEQYAKENNAEHFEIVEDSYEYEHGLILIVYNDKEHEDEDYHVCIDVLTMQ